MIVAATEQPAKQGIGAVPVGAQESPDENDGDVVFVDEVKPIAIRSGFLCFVSVNDVQTKE